MAVARCLVALLGTPLFWRSTGLSLLRILCGSVGGMGAGVILAVFTSKCKWADWIISPAIRVVRSVPVASFILLVLLWLKTGFVPAVISGLMVMPVIWQSVSQGIRNTDPQLVELARVYSFGTWKTLRYVYLPAVHPFAVSGVCNAVGLGWKSGVAAEVLCLPKAAIGTQVYYSKLYLESPSLFAWTIVVILLSMAVEHLVRRVLHREGGAG
jgi:NitT/TauT family transport system permease protein